MSRPLPTPVTVTDELLLAIHDRLGELLDRLPDPPARGEPGEPVELREPATTPSRDAAPTAVTAGGRPAPSAKERTARPRPRTKTNKET